jgi:hypothetical protein
MSKWALEEAVAVCRRIVPPSHMADAEAVEHLLATKTARELAEYIVRREAGWRKAAKKRERPLQERLGDKIIIRGFTPDDCYIWRGSTNGRGYGIIWNNGRRRYVHRVTYELEHGPIPKGLMIDHLCRETLCCNPSHLEAVTNRENTLRGKVSALRHLRKRA